MGGAAPPETRDDPADVHVLDVDGREIILVGTAHVSRESVDLVRAVIE
ncbi:MAG TPA: TraB family protein, partial [Myxococcota bacterium]